MIVRDVHLAPFRVVLWLAIPRSLGSIGSIQDALSSNEMWWLFHLGMPKYSGLTRDELSGSHDPAYKPMARFPADRVAVLSMF